MVALYVTSLSSGAGKSTICAGLGKVFQDKGKKIGYLRLAIGAEGNGDAAFFKRLLGMEELVKAIAPAFGDEAGLESGLKQAYDRIAAGKDIVIIEGALGQGKPSADVAAALDAKVIVVADYSDKSAQVVEIGRTFGTRLLGVIVNKVPASRLPKARGDLQRRLEAGGLRVLGVLPEDRSLMALTVDELAEQLHGEMLGGSEKSAGLVENIMVGVSNVDAGPAYYGRKTHKAAVLKSERPDMQMAALETPTTCLILAGTTSVKEIVLDHAREMDVPVVVVKESMPSVVARIEDALVSARFHQDSKLPKLRELMREHIDLDAIGKTLGL